MWGIRFREYIVITFYVEHFMDSITIYCTMIWNIVAIWLANLLWKSTKLASYTYHKVIVTIIKSIFIKIKMIRIIYDSFIICFLKTMALSGIWSITPCNS